MIFGKPWDRKTENAVEHLVDNWLHFENYGSSVESLKLLETYYNQIPERFKHI